VKKTPGTGPSAFPRRPTEDPIVTLLREAYPSVAKELLRPLVELFAETRAMCSGDLQKSEILMLIGLRTLAHPDFARLAYSDIAAGAVERYGTLGTNVRSIADSTGIPRETVRRKVAELVTAGLVERRANRLALCPRASLVLAPLREAALRLAATNFHLVSGLLRPR
jgi:hypothetical protein